MGYRQLVRKCTNPKVNITQSLGLIVFTVEQLWWIRRFADKVRYMCKEMLRFRSLTSILHLKNAQWLLEMFLFWAINTKWPLCGAESLQVSQSACVFIENLTFDLREGSQQCDHNALVFCWRKKLHILGFVWHIVAFLWRSILFLMQTVYLLAMTCLLVIFIFRSVLILSFHAACVRGRSNFHFIFQFLLWRSEHGDGGNWLWEGFVNYHDGERLSYV